MRESKAASEPVIVREGTIAILEMGRVVHSSIPLVARIKTVGRPRTSAVSGILTVNWVNVKHRRPNARMISIVPLRTAVFRGVVCRVPSLAVATACWTMAKLATTGTTGMVMAATGTAPLRLFVAMASRSEVSNATTATGRQGMAAMATAVSSRKPSAVMVGWKAMSSAMMATMWIRTVARQHAAEPPVAMDLSGSFWRNAMTGTTPMAMAAMRSVDSRAAVTAGLRLVRNAMTETVRMMIIAPMNVVGRSAVMGS